MRRSALVVDGLWRCLCPAVDLAFTSRVQQFPKDVGQPGHWSRRSISRPTWTYHQSASRFYHNQRHRTLSQPARSRAASKDVNPRRPQPPLASVSIESLYDWLDSEAGRGSLDEVNKIVTHLVKDRHEEPNIRLYAAMILGNVDPALGSAGKVAALLKEMKTEGINADSGTYHRSLKVR